MTQFKRIAVHHPPGIAIWDSILKGVFQFARPDLPWLIAANFDSGFDEIRRWKPDGAIIQCNNSEDEAFFGELEIPVVNVAREKAKITFPSVQIDDFAVGVMAAEYFLDKGFEGFGCYSLRNRDFMEARLEGFRTRIESKGFAVEVFEEDDYSHGMSFSPPSERLRTWLSELPQPNGVFATTDALGLVIASSCRFAHLKVPEQIAILGASNNELLCNLEYPSLSSIQLPGALLGYEASRRLHSMLNGNEEAVNAHRLEPIGIVNRQSSDIYCIDDNEVGMALEYIKSNFGSPINVSSVVKSVEISRSNLERRFRQLLGRSIHDELIGQRMKMAKRLLATTQMPLREIASETGFSSPRHFSTVFKKQTGEQPGSFRKRING